MRTDFHGIFGKDRPRGIEQSTIIDFSTFLVSRDVLALNTINITQDERP